MHWGLVVVGGQLLTWLGAIAMDLWQFDMPLKIGSYFPFLERFFFFFLKKGTATPTSYLGALQNRHFLSWILNILKTLKSSTFWGAKYLRFFLFQHIKIQFWKGTPIGSVCASPDEELVFSAFVDYLRLSKKFVVFSYFQTVVRNTPCESPFKEDRGLLCFFWSYHEIPSSTYVLVFVQLEPKLGFSNWSLHKGSGVRFKVHAAAVGCYSGMKRA